jgi:hypothetical protein
MQFLITKLLRMRCSCKNHFMKLKLALNFKEIGEDELSIVAFRIIGEMRGNEKYPDAGDLVGELSAIRDQYAQSLARAKGRDVIEVARKNDYKLQLIKKMRELAEYVVKTARGRDDEEIWLINSGFPTVRSGPGGSLGEPTKFTIKPGTTFGEMELRIKRVPGARSYLYQYTADPVTRESIWQSVADTRCKKVISGLPLGVKMWFKVAAIGSNGQIVFTEALWRFVS